MEADKPLKILTLDGGGLQAIPTLTILDNLLDTIARNNKVSHRKPRPCDVFDVIAGIGAGGWLAILLGRFHMDITTCLSEWYRIIHCITPRSKREEKRMGASKHCYFNQNRLKQQINHLTSEYGTGDKLFDEQTPCVRTRHVFVAALRSDAQEYNLFRTYKIPKSGKLREGPEEPSNFKIFSAFEETGSAKHFSPPWKEQMSKSGKKIFNDSKYLCPHNITELALDEVWGLYGKEVALSVVVNIGPSLPNKCDVHQIARRFSWGLTTPSTPTSSKTSRSPLQEAGSSLNKLPAQVTTNDDPFTSSEGPSFHFQENIAEDPAITPERKQAMARSNTFGSDKNRAVKEKLRRPESVIERDIKKSEKFCLGSSTLYCRLAISQAPRGTAQNDSAGLDVTLDAADEYLSKPEVRNSIDEIGRRISNSEKSVR